jgi:hypothetical protein
MSTKEILIAARAILADPAHWTKNTFARDRNNEPIDPTSPDAVCFCAVGAIKKVINIVSNPYSNDLLQEKDTAKFEELRKHTAHLNNSVELVTGQLISIVSFNDWSSTEHADLLAVFDHAINNAGTNVELTDVLTYHQNAVIRFKESGENCDKQFNSCKSDAMRLRWKESILKVAERLKFHQECVKCLKHLTVQMSANG